jgi:uncharacterized protein (DUF302 family)
MRAYWLPLALSVTLVAPLGAQTTSPAAMDSLLDHLVGHWIMTGTVRGRPATYTLEARRVLRGRFVELHMTDVAQPPAYEAMVFVGVDGAGPRYIAHWLDNFGAAYSIPPATGEARGDTVVLDFPYPDGAFRDTFAYDGSTDEWDFRLDAADSTGVWHLFARYQARRRGARAPDEAAATTAARPYLTQGGVMSDDGIRVRRSKYPFDETITRLTGILAEKGITLFTVIDHAGAAAKVGLTMRPTKVLVFGSPKVGTPLMLVEPTLAIDLPLKLLVWEDADGGVWIAWNTAEYLAARHGLSRDRAAPLAVVERLVAPVTQP